MKSSITLLLVIFAFQCITAQEFKEEINNESLFSNAVVYDVNNESVKTNFENFDYENPWFCRRFKLRLGAFFPINNTQIRVGNKKETFGTTIDLEDDLGFKSYTNSFKGDFQWRISKRSRLTLEYFYLVRNSIHTLDKEIEFGENVYPIDAEVDVFFNNNIVRLTYNYAIFCRPKYEIGLLIGSHVIFGDMGIRFNTNIGELERSTDFNFTAPIPDVGIWGDFMISKRFGMYMNANYLSLKVGDYSGRIFSYDLMATLNVYKNLNVNLGYSGLNIKVDVEKQRLKGFFEWGYNGPLISLTYAFGKKLKYNY